MSLKNMLLIIGLVLLILAAIFYFGHILANLVIGIALIAIIMVVVGLVI